MGSHLAERFLDEDIQVVRLDNFVTGSATDVEHLQGRDGFGLIKMDVAAYIAVPDSLGTYDDPMAHPQPQAYGDNVNNTAVGPVDHPGPGHRPRSRGAY